MKKKTWIKVKRGILEPKHREKLGVRIWLYLYMVDQADWETGTIKKWKDKQAAIDMDMPVRTLTTQRQEIEDAGYITCKQGLHCQEVIIHNWTNPREYSGEVYNPKDHGTQNRVPSNGHGTQNQAPYGLRKPRTIYLNPHLKESQWEIPESLQTIEFEDMFMEFLEHRKQIRKIVTQLGGERLIKKLSKYPASIATKMLEQSIENGWTGIFDVKGSYRGSPTNKPEPQGEVTTDGQGVYL